MSDIVERLLTTRDCTVCDGDGTKSNGRVCGGCAGAGKVLSFGSVGMEAANEIERLRALAQPPLTVREGWRPIETAPKDGTAVLLFYPDGERDHDWDDDGKDRSLSAVMRCDERGYWEGYYDAVGPNGEPTHWHPLPANPTTKEGTNEPRFL